MTIARYPNSGWLEVGSSANKSTITDPALVANVLYTQGLGALNLAHLELSVRERHPGLPVVDTVTADDLLAHLVRGAVAIARGR